MMDSGEGLLPMLMKLFQGSKNDNAGANAAAAGGITNPIAALTPIDAGSDAAIGPDGIRNPISGPMQPGARLDAMGMPLTPGQMQPIAAGYTNPLPNPNLAYTSNVFDSNYSPMSGLGDALSGLGKAVGAGGPTNTPGGAPYQPPPAPVPQGGGGPNPAMFAAQQAAQQGGLSMNPILLNFLRARLANSGGGGLGGLG